MYTSTLKTMKTLGDERKKGKAAFPGTLLQESAKTNLIHKLGLGSRNFSSGFSKRT